MPAKVMLLAIGLGVGGTETHILELASRLDRSRFTVTVCTFKPGGTMAQELQQRGVRVLSLDGAGKLDARVILRLFKLLRAEQPDVVQAFLFWANAAARACGRILRAFPVISSYHDEIVSEDGGYAWWIDSHSIGLTASSAALAQSVDRSSLGLVDKSNTVPLSPSA